ncbi:MAG: PIN domain-containing protein [Candidatus Hadarchaeota archaeon]
MILVDSSIWNAARRKRDRLHDSSEKVLEKIMNGVYGRPVVTDYIVDEVLTWLNRHTNHQTATDTADFFFKAGQVEVIMIDWAVLREAYEVFKRYNFLSFTDSTTAAVAKARGIKNIATLDSDFSKLGFKVVGN